MPFENLDKMVLNSGNGYEAGDGVDSENGVVFHNAWNNLWTALSEFFGFGFYKGINCDNKSSNATSCEIWLMLGGSGTTAQRKCGAVAGQKVRVHYTTGGDRYIFLIDVQEDTGNPYIQFDKDDVRGRTPTETAAAITNFADATFIDNLNIFVADEFPAVIADEDLLFQYDAPGSLIATDIPTDDTASDTIGDETVVIQGTVEAGLTAGTGIVKADKVTSDSLVNNEIMADDSPRNLSRGMFDNALYRADMLYGLDESAAAALSYAVETTIVKAGSKSQKFSTNGSAQGIKILLDQLVDMKLLAGKKMTIVAWVRSSVANKLELGFYDNVSGIQTTLVTHAADSWTKVSVTIAIGAAATEVYGLVLSTDGTAVNSYVDIAGIYIGETAFDPIAPSVYASIVNNVLGNRVYNFLPFSGLGRNDSGEEPGHAWLNGTNSPPVGWDGSGDTDVDDSDFMTMGRSWKIDLDAGEMFYTNIGIRTGSGWQSNPVNQLRGKSITFALWLKKDGTNTEDLDLTIEEDIGAGLTEVATNSFTVNDYSDWAQIAVTGVINSGAYYIRIRIKNNGSATITAKIDQLMFTQTAHPIAYTSLTPWQYHGERFAMSGTVADGLMSQNGMAYEIPVGVNMIAYGMTVTEQSSGTGTDSFYPKVGGVSETDLQVDLDGGEDYESVHYANGVYISSGDTLGVYCDADAVFRGDDAIAVVHCLIWGI